ncbi:MAG: PAS domain-containing protein [Crocinitomicaceae bacterium]|nr:PAS domain-containing protein [Crocinitomicaceae bacterium]
MPERILTLKEKINAQKSALAQMEQDLHLLLNEQSLGKHRSAGTWQYYFHGDVFDWSDEIYTIFGVTKEHKNLFSNYWQHLKKKEQIQLRRKFEHILEKKIAYFEVFQNISIPLKSGIIESKKLQCIGYPLIENQEIIGVKGVMEVIEAKDTGVYSLTNFFDASLDLQCIANENGYFIKVSPSWTEITGYSEMELCSQPFTNFVHPEDLNNTIEETKSLTQGNDSVNFQNRYITKQGDEIILDWKSRKDPLTGLFYCTARDISLEVKQKEELQSHLIEKEILIKEIHHRVKNNLQIISSLLSLQAKISGQRHPELHAIYADSRHRIQSMAAIHEMFYRSKSLDKLLFSNYIEKLTTDLLVSFYGANVGVQLHMDLEPIYFNLDTCIPLGLLTNEVVTNALKHGLKDAKDPVLTVRLKKLDKSNFELTIGDNGKSEFNPARTQTLSMGLTIIESMVEQLDGKIEHRNLLEGNFYIIKFQEQKAI